VKNRFVDDALGDRIAVESGEPHVAIGRILALKYDSTVGDPLPRRMLALLAQLDTAQNTGEEGFWENSTRAVRCQTCNAAYERSTFKGFARERSSFECYGCGRELEKWDTDLVPTYRIAVPVAGSAEDPVRRTG
jgi:hypothetical protein